MPQQLATTHTLIENELVVYLRNNSPLWQCRYKVEGLWKKTSTKTDSLKKAKSVANNLMIEAKVLNKRGFPVINRTFKSVAELAIERMENEKAAGRGKVSYDDYIRVIEKYLIECLGKYNIANIDYDKLDHLDAWRIEKMGRTPSRSTIVTHNAALNRVFDEAIQRNYLTVSSRPTLKVSGNSSERRPHFDIHEIKAVLANFDDWVERGRTEKSKELRKLLKDYVHVLTDTGARPGDELMNLKWKQLMLNRVTNKTSISDIDFSGKPINNLITKKYNFEMTVTGKTGTRTLVANIDTIFALLRIIKRNYNIENNFSDPLKNIPTTDDYVFRTKDKTRPTSFPKMFDSYLDEHNLLIDPKTDNKRVLYSLRHTYATNQLLHDEVMIYKLTKQMGTSVAMIEKHYDHLNPAQAIEQLRGDKTRELLKNTPVDDKYKSKRDVK